MDAQDVKICIAAQDEVKTFFAYDLARLMAFTASQRPNLPLRVQVATGSLIPRQRETLLAASLADPSTTHIFYVDSDMRFPKDALLRLLSREVPVVGASYTARKPPFQPNAWLNLETDERLYTNEESTGLQQVAALGFGCILIEAAAVIKLQRPRFLVGYIPDTGAYVGEDIYFCHQLRAAKIPLFVDHDLSKDVSHLGTFEFCYTHAEASRVMAEEPPPPEIQPALADSEAAI